MKLHAEIDGDRHEIEIEREGSHAVATVDGRKYDLTVSEPEPGVYLFKKDGRIFEAFASKGETGPSTVSIGGSSYEIDIIDPKRLRGVKGDSSDASGKAEIKTAMPGKVVRILVSTGDEVKKGDGVIVVEAMKMQNEMKAPKDGLIAEIKFVEGDTVAAGDVLIVIE